MAKKVVIISASLRGGSNSDDKAYNGLPGWVECFEKAELKGLVTGGGIGAPGEASGHPDAMQRAYELGLKL